MARKRAVVRWLASESRLPAVQDLSQVANHTPDDLCGPTAIAAITGLPLRSVYAAIIRSRGYTPEKPGPITGMPIGEVISILGMLGFRADVFDIVNFTGCRLTLRRFFMDRGDDEAACIAVTRNHFVAVDWGIVVDNHTNGLYGDILEHPYRNASVINYIEVRKL